MKLAEVLILNFFLKVFNAKKEFNYIKIVLRTSIRKNQKIFYLKFLKFSFHTYYNLHFFLLLLMHVK